MQGESLRCTSMSQLKKVTINVLLKRQSNYSRNFIVHFGGREEARGSLRKSIFEESRFKCYKRRQHRRENSTFYNRYCFHRKRFYRI